MAFVPPVGNKSKEEISSLLDSVRNPFEIAIYGSGNAFNVGGCIRSAHNFMASKIHLIDVDPGWYKKGAVAALKWEKKNIVKETLEQFIAENDGRNVVAFEHREGLQSQDLRAFEYPDMPVFVFGNEKFGVPKEIFSIAKHVVSIPMFGLILDHNLTTAASIVMYDYSTKHKIQRTAIGELLNLLPEGQEERTHERSQ